MTCPLLISWRHAPPAQGVTAALLGAALSRSEFLQAIRLDHCPQVSGGVRNCVQKCVGCAGRAGWYRK
jgi:hypothetical protein